MMSANENGMVKLTINGVEVSADPVWSLLETTRFYGIDVSTLCYVDGLTPYGACRLCGEPIRMDLQLPLAL